MGDVTAKDVERKPAFVLIHGAWHGAWCFSKLVPYLLKAGHVVAARDLPGHGGLAKYPKSFGQRSADETAFAIERSPLAGVTLADYVSDTLETVDALLRAGSGPVILLGHSMGGIPITAVAEAAPEKIRKLVYLTAFMPASGVPAIAYSRTPEAEGAKVGAAMKGDPARIGAFRLDPRSTDANYVSNLKQAFAGDLSDAEWEVAQNLLSPDDPAQPFVTPTETTRSRWGKIPRTYIKCSGDFAIRPLTQAKFIDAADQFTPDNKTEVYELDSSHSPFLSQPEKLANVLVELASR
ncbi:alpha/beta fold hydrolase [Bradyrhizobium sp. AUGA SZCCT0042]|uniref:alpha/beta fold hydrolase n=1 Tax=Bradyrhizobium sp. AUGA SZCCT0042 TaxID=2807651 RepID=UPI001BAB3B5B|nr:alpha/beta fold hydrolase [Bradyrhizobium sp. AUGA SZCCT0042]MBR1301081.1 alpha/beta fold hydrolase [Bradyrhizobium sp. AUGA SZCCT0042]